MDYQLEWNEAGRTKNAPDVEAIKLLQFYEGAALHADPRGYCVCTSEGKDSRVLGHLMRRAGVRHFYMHNITGIDPPELVYFQRANFQTYRDLGYLTYDVLYEMSMWELCRKKRMLPMRQRRFCCESLKERPAPECGKAFKCMGVRKFESSNRMKKRNELEIVEHGKDGKNIVMPFDNSENRRIFEQCYTTAERRVNPIAYWTDSDIWDYSKDVGLEQCSLYDEGFTRLGCIGCPMARRAGREHEFNRWPKFRDQYIRTAQHIIDDRIRDGLEPFKLASTGIEYFDWWMQDRAQEEANNDQMDMWEEA